RPREVRARHVAAVKVRAEKVRAEEMPVLKIAARKIAADEMTMREIEIAEVEPRQIAFLHHHAPAVRDAFQVALMEVVQAVQCFLADPAADDRIAVGLPLAFRRRSRRAL